jgi:hypothetical protein
MAENRGKPPGKAPSQDAFTNTGSGRVGRDDRGNMTWEWADEDGLLDDDEIGKAERIRALVDPTLKVQEDEIEGNAPIQPNPKGLKKGYNPYDSGALGKAEWKKKKDLRELSKWIELRKKLEPADEPGKPPEPDDET